MLVILFILMLKKLMMVNKHEHLKYVSFCMHICRYNLKNVTIFQCNNTWPLQYFYKNKCIIKQIYFILK